MDIDLAATTNDKPPTPPPKLSASSPPSPRPTVDAPPFAKQEERVTRNSSTSTPAPKEEKTDRTGAPAAMVVDDPPAPQGEQEDYQGRQLNVKDALTYLDQVKIQFQDLPDVYNQFLDIMKEFKNEQITTPGVIRRVSQLFHGHPSLIQGFNTFLPAGYRIECGMDALETGLITVTTPEGTTSMHTTSVEHTQAPPPHPFADAPPPTLHIGPPPASHHHMFDDGPSMYEAPPPEVQAIEPAVNYVQKIKANCDPETYRQFLAILSKYHHDTGTIDQAEVSRQISHLFKGQPELANDFRKFMPMPDRPAYPTHQLPTSTLDSKGRRKLDAVADSLSNSAWGHKRKRKAEHREKEAMPLKSTVPPANKKPKQSHQDISYNPKHIISSPHPSTSQLTPQPQPAVSNVRAVPADDSNFFDKVKRSMDTRETYNEFLKLVNLFTQDFIDMARLVKESRNFLGDTELYRQFIEILGWDGSKERAYVDSERMSLSADWHKPSIVNVHEEPSRVQPADQFSSYRRVSAAEANVPCSGRDEMCRLVLNDDYVSHPAWSSEDTGFIPHKKNAYEEALHRSEEERHEYDFHIEAITRTIAMLEPISNKIASMNAEDRGSFKVKPNLGGVWKAIHTRVVKKIYGADAGLDVIQCIQEQPALAVPVVLARLKQKEEEWKRAQREWNKVWREVDARNYAKSLDHQAITFKAADKKAVTAKALVNQIETAREEQVASRASLIDPLFSRTRPRHQLDFVLDDSHVLQDSIKLTFSFLDRTQAQINFAERRRIETFLRVYIPLFFTLDPSEFNSAFVVPQEHGADSEGSEGETPNGFADDDLTFGPGGSSRRAHQRKAGGGLAGGAGDLRKKLLKSEQAKSSRKTRAQDASPAASRFASPAPMDEDYRAFTPNSRAGSKAPSPGRRLPRRHIFFTNTHFYVLTRLLQLLISRLALFKDLSAQIAEEHAKAGMPKPAPPSTTMGLPAQAMSGDITNKEHHYEWLLDTCERLFDNEIETHAFEDQMRAVFGNQNGYKIFTIDKVISAFIKQVQIILGDPKSQELLEVLKRERALNAPTTQEQITTRRNAEKILGPDENVFRIDWLSDSKTITVQLIGKDDSRFDDSEVLTGRWQSYIDSFVSADATAGVSQSKLKSPFLRRNIPASMRGSPASGSQEQQPSVNVASTDSLEIKVCVRTYRLFYVSNSEDFLWKYRAEDDVRVCRSRLDAAQKRRAKWLEESAKVPPPVLEEEEGGAGATAEAEAPSEVANGP